MGDANLGEVVTSSELLCRALNDVSLEDKPMKKVKLSTETFNGNEFYEMYKNAEFLKLKRNVTKIFSQQDEFTAVLGTMKPGEKLVVDGMFIKPGVPLIITKTGKIDESDVNSDEFTHRRLTGLAAAYVWNNIRTFEAIYAKEPEALNLCWTNKAGDCRIYLSAITGTELFESAFEFIPFICALKKYTLKMIAENMLLHIASLPHSVTGEPMAVWYRRKFKDYEFYSQRLFKSEYSWQLGDVVYKAAPSSVQRYLFHLGPY